MGNTSSCQNQSYPTEAKVIHKRSYPADVENSVRRYLFNQGFDNPNAFISRFDLADIFIEMTTVLKMMESNSNIRNPAGLLWRMLEARERNEKKAEEV